MRTTTTRDSTASTCMRAATTSAFIATRTAYFAAPCVCVATITLSRVVRSFIIWDLHVGWPGSNGDSTIWQHQVAELTKGRSTKLEGRFDTRRAFLQPYTYLVGDCAYPLTTGVMTPYSTVEAEHDGAKGLFNFVQRSLSHGACACARGGRS